ncbi:DUF4058 family protein [Nostoc sp. FACHB-152]|uniref:DUF4058 family protein n=1 Tax=unclassified Nostoc TaxID=2593658 RepID=UPI0016859BFB|nr:MULTISPECIES: DUF4058 family protein [unclassified Nostoc]MBD2448560.1 DUF4058 family protein [Nostoc sp. FACHB-152]MBD2469972.1 DUF4058 family protein [Nostoc sp. FACHB-145]
MPSPFPGMNPYLELPSLWHEFHSRLIVAISDALTPYLQPKYYVAVETRTYLDDEDTQLLVGIPDAVVLSASNSPVAQPTTTATQTRPKQIRLPMQVEVKERYLEVREVGTHQVITVIEVLSPKNKRKGEGRTAYEKKRQRVLGSLSHLVEIDLLRENTPMPMIGVEETSDYRIIVSRATTRPMADLYEFQLREPIPNFSLPLKSDDPELAVDLQTILLGVYDRGSYQFRIDYHQPVPPPKLSAADQQWIDELLAAIRGG